MQHLMVLPVFVEQPGKGLEITAPQSDSHLSADLFEPVHAREHGSRLVPVIGQDIQVDIAGQVTSIMTADQLRDQLSRASYVVTPAIDRFSSSDFDSKDSLIGVLSIHH